MLDITPMTDPLVLPSRRVMLPSKVILTVSYLRMNRGVRIVVDGELVRLKPESDLTKI